MHKLGKNPTEVEKDKLWKVCESFIEKRKISCPETIHQTDDVILNAYSLIEKICNVVGYYEYKEDD